MRIPAASCSTVHAVVTGAAQQAELLGACPSALYLRTRSGDVIAVLTRDAVRLPCALIVPRRSGELPLSSLVATPPRPVWVGEGAVRWAGPHGPTTVVAAAHWQPPALAFGAPDTHAVARAEALIAASHVDIGMCVDRDADPVPTALLGRGPGLTPSGDDVLAGYLIGARAFGVRVESLAALVERDAAQQTSALSAQLLRNAAAGQCTPQLADLVAACVTGRHVDKAVAAVLRIGSSSGAALATGLLIAAGRAGRDRYTEAAA